MNDADIVQYDVMSADTDEMLRYLIASAPHPLRAELEWIKKKRDEDQATIKDLTFKLEQMTKFAHGRRSVRKAALGL